MKNLPISEGLQVTRLMMVLSSMSPLFVLWAVRGSEVISDQYFIPICTFFATCPTVVLCRRIRIAKEINDFKNLTIGTAEDHRDHLLVYLFAMLLPLYPAILQNDREFSAAIVALVFVVFLFWHLNMHYMNLVFALQGYRVFTVTPKVDNLLSGKTSFVLLTKRCALAEGEQIEAYRMSNSVFIEK